jgi:hypothetical protein
MKKITAIIALLLAAQLSSTAQIKALTSSGDEVLLYEDGTWKYNKSELTTESDLSNLATNPIAFNTSKGSSFEVKSKKVNASVFLNPKKWTFNASGENEASEFDFDLRNGDVYAMMINEKTEIPLPLLKEIAIKNAREVASDLVLAEEEFRMVNNKKFLCLQMNGTIKGLKFSYFSYYYSSSKGTIQFITYTSRALFNENRKEMEELLNGLTIND